MNINLESRRPQCTGDTLKLLFEPHIVVLPAGEVCGKSGTKVGGKAVLPTVEEVMVDNQRYDDVAAGMTFSFQCLANFVFDPPALK